MGFLIDTLGLSERRSCRIVGLSRSVQQYRPAPKNDAAAVGRLRELAAENRRYGYLRLHALLRREGLVANRKRTYRLYTEQGLQVRTKKRRKLPRRDRIAPQVPARPMQRWSLTKSSDQRCIGRAGTCGATRSRRGSLRRFFVRTCRPSSV